MKKSLLVVAVLLLCGVIASSVYASERMHNQDMYDNNANYVDISCSEGKIIGAAYFDFKNDSADAVTAICMKKDGTTMMPKSGDWQFVCMPVTTRLWQPILTRISCSPQAYAT